MKTPTQTEKEIDKGKYKGKYKRKKGDVCKRAS